MIKSSRASTIINIKSLAFSKFTMHNKKENQEKRQMNHLLGLSNTHFKISYN